ncbi:MAG: hypothetical protein J6U43_02715 [Bacteroidales bacterium]|nr:hypothetical protein [Bacteroidales bacterium]
MKFFRYIQVLSLALVACMLLSCANEDVIFPGEGKEVTVNFRPTIDVTRAIGDASSIDQLIVGVYEGNDTKTRVYTDVKNWDDVKKNGGYISLTLIEGRAYHIVFWAQNSHNTAYKFTDNGSVTVNYTDYQEGGFAKMEQMDAFCATISVTVSGANASNPSVTLKRPLAQFNIADDTTQPIQGTHKAVVTFHGAPASFNPFTGEVVMGSDDVAFTFTDFPTETLSVAGVTYYYISSNYLFAPAANTTTIDATLDLQNIDGTSIKTIQLDDVTLEHNK